MILRNGVFAALAALLVLEGGAAVLAEEASPPASCDEAVAGFVANIYNPQEKGLNNLSVELETPFFRDNPIFGHVKVMFYCKTPDLFCADIEGLPEETRDFFLQQIKPLSAVARYLFVLGSIMKNILLNSSVTVVRDGDLSKITATPRPGSLGKKFRMIVLWIDGEFKPIRMEQHLPDLAKVSVDMEVVRREGKYLPSILKARGIKGFDGEISLKIAYEKKGKIWLPSAVIFSVASAEDKGDEGAPNGELFRFIGYRINEGMDESLFARRAEEDGEKKGEESRF